MGRGRMGREDGERDGEREGEELVLCSCTYNIHVALQTTCIESC